MNRFASKHPEGPPADPAQAAAYWVARRRLGLMTARDEAAFTRWREDPGNGAHFDEAEGVVEEAGAIAALSEVRAMRQAALAASAPGLGWRPAAAAAALAAMLGVGVWVARAPAPPAAPGAVASASAAQRYETKVGERLNVRLGDGSVVALNTATVMEVAYSAGRRDVRLLRGQAMFQVARNKARPFVVTAGDRQVTALGTAFDVRLDGERVKVVLVEGRVVVDPVRPVGLERLIPVLAQRELDPGEQFVSAPDQRASVSDADTDRATSWRRGQVIFRDDTLAAAVAEMNRYSAQPIVIADPQMGELRISGVFGATRDENFVAAVTAFYPIAAEPRPGGATALVWRDGPVKDSSPPS